MLGCTGCSTVPGIVDTIGVLLLLLCDVRPSFVEEMVERPWGLDVDRFLEIIFQKKAFLK